MGGAVSALALTLALPGITVGADPIPTGEVQIGQGQLEPAYNDITGAITFLLTPLHGPAVDRTNQHAAAPLYLILYPTSAASSVGALNCQHPPMDNCPDHGPEVAGLVESIMPSVYGSGVLGHDHLIAGPPSPPAVGNFNVAWEPIAVLFTNSAAANLHITTWVQLSAAMSAGLVTTVPLPGATFQCSVVPAAVYRNGTPVTPAPPVP